MTHSLAIYTEGFTVVMISPINTAETYDYCDSRGTNLQLFYMDYINFAENINKPLLIEDLTLTLIYSVCTYYILHNL